MKNHKLMDIVGIKLFLKKFSATTDNVELPIDDYTKYDLLVKDEENLKYVEIKCNSCVLNVFADNYISKSDWDWLQSETPTGSKALYVLFDDCNTVVYDLKAIHHLGHYYEAQKLNYGDQMAKLNAKMETFIYLDFDKCFKDKVMKMYPTGSKKLLGISIAEINKKISNNTLSLGDIQVIFKKMEENK